MGTTTFSGPVRTGTIKFTTGTTLGTDVANIGEVVLSQSQAITQAGPAADGVFTTNIVIPAGSTITSIQLYVGAVWSSGTTTLGIGNTASATAYTSATGVQGSTGLAGLSTEGKVGNKGGLGQNPFQTVNVPELPKWYKY